MGDPILEKVGHDIFEISGQYNPFRIYFQNVNGLKLGAGTEHLERAVGFLREIDPAVICLAETNTNWTNRTAYDRHLKVVKAGFNHARVRTSSSGIPQKSMYQPGGTSTVVVRHWVGRTTKTGSDSEGSFSWVRMRGRRGRQLTIITCYRVYQDSNSGLGNHTAHTQQETILRIMGQEYPNPRKYCLEALQTFIEG